MDELTLLCQLRTDLDQVSAGPDTAALLRARRRLLEHAVGPQVAQLRRRRRWPRIAVAAAAAAVLAGGVGAAQILRPGNHVLGATTAAAAALNDAAANTIHTSDPVVGPNQYLKVTTRAVALGDGPTASGSEPGKDPLAGKTDHLPYRFSLETFTLYKPGQDTRDWILHRSGLAVTYDSPRDKVLWESLGQIANVTTPAETIRAPHAHFLHVGDGLNMQAGAVVTNWSAPDPAFLAALPRDPAHLLASIRTYAVNQGPSPDAAAFNIVLDTLRGGYVPADLRAALFQTATLIPGVDILPGSITLDGRTGTAVSYTEPHGGWRQDLVFDKDTGHVIGERTVTTAPDTVNEIPTGTILYSTSVTTAVVNSAP